MRIQSDVDISSGRDDGRVSRRMALLGVLAMAGCGGGAAGPLTFDEGARRVADLSSRMDLTAAQVSNLSTEVQASSAEVKAIEKIFLDAPGFITSSNSALTSFLTEVASLKATADQLQSDPGNAALADALEQSAQKVDAQAILFEAASDGILRLLTDAGIQIAPASVVIPKRLAPAAYDASTCRGLLEQLGRITLAIANNKNNLNALSTQLAGDRQRLQNAQALLPQLRNNLEAARLRALDAMEALRVALIAVGVACLSGSIRACALAVIALDQAASRAQRASSNYARARDALRDVENRIANLTQRIASAEADISRLQDAIAQLERDAQALNPQIQDACTSGGVWIGY